MTGGARNLRRRGGGGGSGGGGGGIGDMGAMLRMAGMSMPPGMSFPEFEEMMMQMLGDPHFLRQMAQMDPSLSPRERERILSGLGRVVPVMMVGGTSGRASVPAPVGGEGGGFGRIGGANNSGSNSGSGGGWGSGGGANNSGGRISTGWSGGRGSNNSGTGGGWGSNSGTGGGWGTNSSGASTTNDAAATAEMVQKLCNPRSPFAHYCEAAKKWSKSTESDIELCRRFHALAPAAAAQYVTLANNEAFATIVRFEQQFGATRHPEMVQAQAESVAQKSQSKPSASSSSGGFGAAAPASGGFGSGEFSWGGDVLKKTEVEKETQQPWPAKPFSGSANPFGSVMPKPRNSSSASFHSFSGKDASRSAWIQSTGGGADDASKEKDSDKTSSSASAWGKPASADTKAPPSSGWGASPHVPGDSGAAAAAPPATFGPPPKKHDEKSAAAKSNPFGSGGKFSFGAPKEADGKTSTATKMLPANDLETVD